MAQTVLAFKLEATEKLLAANAGLAQEMPKPGSGRGYEACANSRAKNTKKSLPPGHEDFNRGIRDKSER